MMVIRHNSFMVVMHTLGTLINSRKYLNEGDCLKSSDIIKIKYVWKNFSPDVMRIYRKNVYEIFDSGRVIVSQFVDDMKSPKSRIVLIKNKSSFSGLTDKVNECIAEADRLETYVDDSEASITIIRPFGRIEKLDRGIGNPKMLLGCIIEDYIKE